jgi:sulfate transport system permease protein
MTLGATPWQIFGRVMLPPLLPALLTGVAMAFARGVGEYGSVIFIAGNRPAISEIVPLLIVSRLEQFDYPGAAVLGCAMLALSLLLLLGINALQRRGAVSYRRAHAA